MKIRITTPTKAYLEECSAMERHELVKMLSYTNTSNAFLVKRHANQFRWKQSNPVSWEIKNQELKGAVNSTLIFGDEGGEYIRPGSIPYLESHFDIEVINEVVYPAPKKIAWVKPPTVTLYPYQEESVVKLIDVKHGNVELCTGSGKTLALLDICRRTGFRTAIIVPSKSIFLELLEKFEHHFGKAQVGTFGAGKKKLGKRFTICIGDSLVNVEKGSKEWEFFSNLELNLFDESHLIASETLEEVCNGLLADVPYRLFCSGTQVRGDGSLKLLQSIIGKTVCSLTTADAVAGGFICPHEFRIVGIPSANPNYQVPDAMEMKRVHLLNNRNILEFAAKLANSQAKINKRQTLILVQELSQISVIAKLLQVPFALAHSETKKDRLAELGISKVSPSESIEKFNKGEVAVLVGTSCIDTGVNIFNPSDTIFIQGGMSEVKCKQAAVGRSVRFARSNPFSNPWVQKEKTVIWDFDVLGIKILERHLKKRIEYYEESGSTIRYIKL